MDEVRFAANQSSTNASVSIFNQIIQGFGLPEELIRPWLEQKLNLYGFNKETLTLDQARELTAELVLEFFLSSEA